MKLYILLMNSISLEARRRLGLFFSTADRVSAYLLLPLVLCSEVINNQSWSAYLNIGKTVNVITILVALCLTFNLAKPKAWLAFVLIFFCVATGRHNSLFSGSYIVMKCLLYAGASAALFIQRPLLISRQFLFISMASTLMMLLQVLGIGEWTLWLTTHGAYADGLQHSKELVPTLFISKESLNSSFLQGRPSGFLHSNQFASLVCIASIAYYYLVPPTKNRLLAFIPYAGFAVLLLAKVVLLSVIAMSVLAFGLIKAKLRHLVGKIIIGYFLCMIIYYIFFPGIVSQYTGAYTFSASFYSRIYDIVNTVQPNRIDKNPLQANILEKVEKSIGQHESSKIAHVKQISGISQLLKDWQLNFSVILLCLYIFIKRWQTGIQTNAILTNRALIYLVGVSSFLIAAPFLYAPSFWFFMGIGFSPFFANSERMNKRTVPCLSITKVAG